MVHQCVRCSSLYEDGNKALLRGCEKCGGKFFFFIKKESMNKVEQLNINLTREDKERMEKDVKEIIGSEFKEETPIVLELENIKVIKPGKFEIDLVDLFKGRPLVYKIEEGKYFIDIPSTFEAKDLNIEKKKENKSE